MPTLNWVLSRKQKKNMKVMIVSKLGDAFTFDSKDDALYRLRLSARLKYILKESVLKEETYYKFNITTIYIDKDSL